jgi:hypothetical protein
LYDLSDLYNLCDLQVNMGSPHRALYEKHDTITNIDICDTVLCTLSIFHFPRSLCCVTNTLLCGIALLKLSNVYCHKVHFVMYSKSPSLSSYPCCTPLCTEPPWNHEHFFTFKKSWKRNGEERKTNVTSSRQTFSCQTNNQFRKGRVTNKERS